MLAILVLLLPLGLVAQARARVVANDNRMPAGELRDGVLTLRLDAVEGLWYPERDFGPGLEIDAFAEAGRAPSSPGPLIRVPTGTEVRVVVNNRLDRVLTLHGFADGSMPSLGEGEPRDPGLEVQPGASREVRFHAIRPGTYYYWGRTRELPVELGAFEDGQLSGALIVDPPGRSVDDRILFVALWDDASDTAAARITGRATRHTFLVNGLSWPHTERYVATVGDTLRWRVINASVGSHPMHLHGFYYKVESRGDAAYDTIYAPDAHRLVVTELMRRGTTMAMSWTPRRPGNWLFHCHFIAHMTSGQRLGQPVRFAYGAAGKPPQPLAATATHGDVHDAFTGMAGLVSGIEVRPAPGQAIPVEEPRRRVLRLYANARARFFGEEAGYGFVLQEGATPPARDSVRVPGTPLALVLGEPVEIRVFNRAPEAITVHWHGIELDSYYDGVGGWSGGGTRIAPAIAPGDSFVVRMTPDRAGTFIYHTHNEEGAQLNRGLYGPLIVLEPGARYDAATDRILLLGWGGTGPDAAPLLNGNATPPTIELRAGATYRLRFINITPSNNQRVRLVADSQTVLTWRRFAKDGATLPSSQAIQASADQFIGAGETYDFEITPTASDGAGPITLEITTFMRRGRPPVIMRVPVRYREALEVP
jgi:FtsP/CotA-like multicopper oxidase with cupredoxin domain